MGIVAEVLEERLGERIESFKKYSRSKKRTLKKPQEVAADQQDLGFQAWSDVEFYASDLSENGVLLWHDGMPAKKICAAYRDGASRYAALMEAYDFSQPGAREISVHAVYDLEAEKRSKDFLGIKKRREGSYVRFLQHYQFDTYAAESALICAMIAQDWELTATLAENHPLPMKVPRRGYQSFLLLRFAVLGDRRAKKYAEGFPARLQGIDFPPRRGDFVSAVVERDEKKLAKALSGINATFRSKWDIQKYITPQWLRRHGGSRERLVEAIRRDLLAHRWLYSPWSVALMCLAAREGMVTLADKPNKFSDFVPHALCCPEN